MEKLGIHIIIWLAFIFATIGCEKDDSPDWPHEQNSMSAIINGEQVVFDDIDSHNFLNIQSSCARPFDYIVGKTDSHEIKLVFSDLGLYPGAIPESHGEYVHNGKRYIQFNICNDIPGLDRINYGGWVKISYKDRDRVKGRFGFKAKSEINTCAQDDDSVTVTQGIFDVDRWFGDYPPCN